MGIKSFNMAKKISGGLVLYEQINGTLKFLIAHPGGPFFKNRDDGYWSIPKGEPEEKEEIFDAAVREFEEETGLIPKGPYINLGSILQKNGKLVYAWGFAGSWVEGAVPKCNEITLEYPKGSGKVWTFPEIDRAIMMLAEEAKQKLSAKQAPFIDRLIQSLNEKERVTKS
jgi:predicted NUDIX family NTP pyrophosphohydrolase